MNKKLAEYTEKMNEIEKWKFSDTIDIVVFIFFCVGIVWAVCYCQLPNF